MHIILLKCSHVQIAFLKFTSCDNQALVYSNCYCSCSFEAEIIKISQSSHKMYSNNIVNFQEPTPILNACTKEVWKPIEGSSYVIKSNKTKSHIFNIYIYILWRERFTFIPERGFISHVWRRGRLALDPL